MAAFKAASGRYLANIGVDPKSGELSPDGGPLDAEGRGTIIRDVVSSATLNAEGEIRYQLRLPAPKVAITSSSPAWT